jgi:hypothetical protein
MKVADVQQFVSGIVQSVRAAGASEKVCSDLRQVGDLLEPYKERTLAELGGLLRTIDEFQRTGRWPEQITTTKAARRPAASKPPKLTVSQAAQKVMALLERVNDPDLEYGGIDAELKAIEPLTKPDLLKVAQEVGMTIASRSSKKEILEELRRRVRDRKGSFERTRFRPDTADARPPEPQYPG